MPAHKGVEPWTRIWVIQASVSFKPFGSQNYSCTQNMVAIFVTNQGYLDYKNFLAHQTSTQARIWRLVADYGEQKWFNDKIWMQTQFNDMLINGNFVPNLQA